MLCFCYLEKDILNLSILFLKVIYKQKHMVPTGAPEYKKFLLVQRQKLIVTV